jgi:Spy/CpxP family protein refolding chaperone
MDPLQNEQQASLPKGNATEEQKQQLFNLIDKTREKLHEVRVRRGASKQSAEKQRLEMLREVFSRLGQAGVDLNDPASVSRYLGEMKERNPRAAQGVEAALNSLLGPETSQQENMNNETIPEIVRKPIRGGEQ